MERRVGEVEVKGNATAVCLISCAEIVEIILWPTTSESWTGQVKMLPKKKRRGICCHLLSCCFQRVYVCVCVRGSNIYSLFINQCNNKPSVWLA